MKKIKCAFDHKTELFVKKETSFLIFLLESNGEK